MSGADNQANQAVESNGAPIGWARTLLINFISSRTDSSAEPDRKHAFLSALQAPIRAVRAIPRILRGERSLIIPIDASEELHRTPEMREYLRAQLATRARRVRAWVMGVSAIVLPLIIGGGVWAGLASPTFIALLGGSALLGLAAATPVGWAVLGLLLAGLTAVAFVGIVRTGLTLAEKYNWGSKLSFKMSPREALLAMLTPKNENAGKLNLADLSAYIAAHSRNPEFTVNSESSPRSSVSLATVEGVSPAPSPRSSVSLASNNKKAVKNTFLKETENKAGLMEKLQNSLTGKLETQWIETSRALKMDEAGAISTLADHASHLAEQTYGYVAFRGNVEHYTGQYNLQAFCSLQKALDDYTKSYPDAQIKGIQDDFDTLIVDMLQSTGAQAILFSGEKFPISRRYNSEGLSRVSGIEVFAAVVKAEHLDKLDYATLEKLSAKFKEHNPAKSGKFGEEARKAEVMLETAMTAKSAAEFSPASSP